MKLQRLKSVLFSVFAVVTVCLLGSCHSATPRWTNSYFHREANVKRICDTMAGTYDMSYFRIYRTGLRGGLVVFKDSALRAMLPDSAAPLQNLLVRYGLSGGLSDKESEGYVRLAPEPLSLSLNVGGKQCVVEFDFDCAIFIGIDGENPTTLKVAPLEFSLDDVKILGGSKQDFDGGWSNGPTFDIYISGERVDQAGQPVRRR